MPEFIILCFLIGFVVCPIWGYNEGKRRNIGGTGGLLLGLFLGLIGILIVFASSKLEDNYMYHFPPLPQHPQPNKESVPDQLKKFKDLLDAGAITEQEYNAQKSKLLNS